MSFQIRTLSVALGLAALCLPDRAEAREQRPPNFVVILIDDLGYADIGCYGSQINQTPEIDKLAERGLRCRDYHSNGPMCSPTRAALLTGCYQQRFGKEFDNALGPKPGQNPGLPLAAATLAEVLRQSGYATGMFGKWHLGYEPPLTPVNQGFDEFRGLVSGDGDHHTHVDRLGAEDWWLNDEIHMESGYTTDLLTDHSVDFIKRHRDQPFFLYFAHLAIHFPWQGPDDPPQRVAGKSYGEDKWGVIPDRRNVSPHVKALVESVDRSVGRVMAELEKHKLAENTLVVFTSDNGGYHNYPDKGGDFERISSNGPLRGQKGELHEGGHRVPAIFVWPGKIAPGQECRETVMSMDLFPTFARLAKAELPAQQKMDGVDLSSLLFDQTPLAPRTLFWRKGELRAVRRGSWKLNVSNRQQLSLYRLDHDLGETTDIAADHKQLVNELAAAYDIWEADVNGGFAK